VPEERRVVALLCLLAAARVLVHVLAFPVFNNMDEQAHFDLVLAYSRGHVPRAIEPIRAEAAHTIALYGSPEFFTTPDQYPGGRYPAPRWTHPPEAIGAALAADAASWQTIQNQQSLVPPLYYALAGAWLALGRGLGLGEGAQLFWIRAFDVACVAALVALAYAVAREAFPDRRFPRLAVPALIAFLPQDAYYAIQSDVLSPLVFAAAFLGLLKLARADVPDVRVAAATGVGLAACGLTRNTNLPLLAVAAAAVLLEAARRARSGRLRPALPGLVALAAFAALPFGAWLVRNQIVLGDFTGSAAQAALQGWTRKPIAQWWPHPIFTPSGVALFWQELTVSLWRGEIVWQGRPLAWRAADLWYWTSSALFLALAALRLVPRAGAPAAERRALGLALAGFAASLAFLAMLSMAFDFGDCVYPSRDHPFFTSGRYLSGALLPYALLYAAGLDTLLSRLRGDAPRFAALAALLLFASVSELDVNRVAFASEWNAFALWRAQ
jgi:hypothetical protein